MKIVLKYCVISILLLFLVMIACSKKQSSWTNPIDDMTYVIIPAGEFSANLKRNNMDSTFTVQFANFFWMSTTEVTVAQFKRFVYQTGYITQAEKDNYPFNWKLPGFEQSGNHPVVYVSYEDAMAYAAWAQASIPLETEWVYACRAGVQTRFFWGDSLDDDYLWHRQNTGGTGTRDVGTKQPNPWGLYNMVGNVREYVKICDLRWRSRGSSWTRCPSYRSRQGFTARNLIIGQIATELTECRKLKYPPYPYDDDRGIRLVRQIDAEYN